MQKTTVSLSPIYCVGLSFRTSNEIKQDEAIASASELINVVRPENWAEYIFDRKNPGKTYFIHTTKQKRDREEYHYFIGEEADFLKQYSEFNIMWIPPQDYIKFTSNPGLIEEVRMDMWGEINKMTSEELGGERLNIADFEVYDERAKDPNNAILDIYIGIIPK